MAQGPIDDLLRDINSAPTGLSEREAKRRLEAVGPNELPAAHRGIRYVGLVRQFTHPLALLLWGAALLAFVSGATVLAGAIVAVIVLNAALAFAQEQQARHAVDALSAYLPERAWVLRDGTPRRVNACELVPGDVLLIDEGDRISADGRLLTGSVEVDMSALSGESVPVERTSETADFATRRIDSPHLVFSGTACVGGSAHALVYATGRSTEIGKIAALSQRVTSELSPLERQVRHPRCVARQAAMV